VPIDLRAAKVAVVLLDIEGTTTPISFVHDVLFPYARARLEQFLGDPAHASDVDAVYDRFIKEHAQDATRAELPPRLVPRNNPEWLKSAVGYAEWLMDRDRKSPGLKMLQGLIWEHGYQARELRGVVFPDVAPAIRRWHAAGIRTAIYSSGSELAQRRLFESTVDGNLVPYLSGFFDTAVGPKTSADSYRAIATALNAQPSAMLFVSDVTRELEAARAAGMQPVLSVRPGNAPQETNDFEAITSFDSLAI
jgi:enolase-phosphatase E1